MSLTKLVRPQPAAPVLALLLLVLGACGPGTPPAPPPTTAALVLPTSTAAPEPTLAPTSTAVPDAPSATATAATTATPLPAATTQVSGTVVTARPSPAATEYPVSVSESSVTFKAYPYEKFQTPRTDKKYNVQYQAFDWGAYQSAYTTLKPTNRTVRAVVLENEYLKLTFLPDLGGRLFQVTYKPLKQDLFYNNKYLKPTNWGPSTQGGWLAVGGMEWSLPVADHGYEWGIPWQYQVMQDENGASITVSDTDAADRVRARITITLPAHAGYFTVHPRIENPTAAPVPVQFWVNAQLSLTWAPNVAGPTEFFLPTDSVYIHSTADDFVPKQNVPADGATGPSAPLAWSEIGGRDLAWYSNWYDYLGVFAAKILRPFAGAYNHEAELGIVRLFAPDAAPGVKLFGFGPKFCCRPQVADDSSDYVELWGGLSRTFFAADDVTLAAGQAREWDEVWMPFMRTEGISAATRDAVLYVKTENGIAYASAYAPVERAATLVLLKDGAELKRWDIQLSPRKPFAGKTPMDSGHLQARLLGSDGQVLAETP